MVNGLFGGPGNWDVIAEQLRQHLDPQQTLLHASTANSWFATHDGIDTCGCRLADEVRGLVAAQPSLTRVSIVAHSMGGLMARWGYAIGQLYNPASHTICGLQPAHFVTLATPHCGCDADGVAQVPFIGWTNELPLLGQQLFRFLQGISGPTAALLFRRTGQQFFMLDGKQQQQQQQLSAGSMTDVNSSNGISSSGSSSSDLPVLLQLTQDCPDRGLFFYSALAAFQTRTCYANTGADHLVGHANSSLRSLGQLPPLPPAAANAKGVVLDDPLTAAFFPQRWQHLQQQQQHNSAPPTAASGAAAGSAVAGGGVPAVCELLAQPYQPSRTWPTPPPQACSSSPAAGPAESPAGSSPRQAMAGLAADSADELMQLEAAPVGLGSAGSGGSSVKGGAEAAATTAAAEADLASGLSGAGTAAAASSESAAEAVAADVASLAAGGASRPQLVAHMLHRLQELPWRRIDVSFQGARFGFAHNNIQVTRRWLNFEGVAVPCHLAQQLQVMEAIVAPAATPAQDRDAAAAAAAAAHAGLDGSSRAADVQSSAGERGDREVAFYAAIEQHRRAPLAQQGQMVAQAPWPRRSSTQPA
ncbi:putative serine esterase-domain-containing protein [Scenedesmus sp. NREL 46B-D3]|nr:putative serine esterase-domain-containing protein [Scenedesmus sp. NREL 46B-D3]